VQCQPHCLSRAPQGDLLVWLLAAALAAGMDHSQAVLAAARSRDEVLLATLELRERAMALHLHFPLKFTLNGRRAAVDVRAAWAAAIARVEKVSVRSGHAAVLLCVCQQPC
jgi:hypothetical protein